MSEPLRIAVGACDIAGVAGAYCEGFRRLGHRVTLALCDPDPHHAAPDHLDVAKDVMRVRWPALAAYLLRGGPTPARLTDELSSTERIAWLLSRHDLFLFYHASFWPDDPVPTRLWGCGREFRLLKALGKRIVTVHSGPDVRHHSAFDQENSLLGNCAPRLAVGEPRWATVPLSYCLSNIRRAERYADLVFSQPNQASLALRPYEHLFVPIDLRRYRARIPGRAIPVVLHAPSRRGVKGSPEIIAAVQRLARRGVRFEFRTIEHAPHDRLRRELEDADVVIDQVHLPLYGRLGVEAMASGCALATCDRVDLEPWPARRPVWHVEPADIDRRLERLLTDRALRLRLAEAGRRYVERHHGAEDVAAGALARLTGRRVGRRHMPEFFARSYRLPSGTRLPRPLLSLTARIVEEWGLPSDLDPGELVRRGLMAPLRT
jgi:glycosyltransferase involved in cell wall biosynthesis